MVRQLTGGKPLPAEVLAQVVAKTDGVPLFVEELVKMLLESGLVREEADGYGLTGPLPPLAIPAMLQDSLMARLDRLSTARTVAQLGAVLGREFAYELIRAVALLGEATVKRGLAQLVDAELLYQRGRPPQARYLFKHALIQETAYQSLLKSTRQQYHQRSAQVLEAQFPEIVETQPELVAHHYTDAGLGAQAIPYWQRAGQQALERSANVEAVRHLTIGLGLLGPLPDTPVRAQQELDLQIALGPALAEGVLLVLFSILLGNLLFALGGHEFRAVRRAPLLYPMLASLAVPVVLVAGVRTLGRLGAAAGIVLVLLAFQVLLRTGLRAAGFVLPPPWPLWPLHLVPALVVDAWYGLVRRRPQAVRHDVVAGLLFAAGFVGMVYGGGGLALRCVLVPRLAAGDRAARWHNGGGEWMGWRAALPTAAHRQPRRWAARAPCANVHEP